MTGRAPTSADTPFDAKAARKKRPLPLWVDALMRDTSLLETDEFGAYIKILMAMWSSDAVALPADPRKMARAAGVSLRLWNSRIWPSLDSYLTPCEEGLTQKRLRKEAAFTEHQCLLQSKRKRGGSDEAEPQSEACALPVGVSDDSHEERENSAKALKNNNTDSTVDDPQAAPRTNLPNYPTTQHIDDADDTRAPKREPPGAAPTVRERIIAAMGGDPVTGITGPSCRVVGTQADMAEANRWLAMPGMTEDVIVAEVQRISAGRPPPSSFRYFTRAMQELSGALSAPSVHPIRPVEASTPAPGRSPYAVQINAADYDEQGRRIRK